MRKDPATGHKKKIAQRILTCTEKNKIPHKGYRVVMRSIYFKIPELTNLNIIKPLANERK